MPAIHTAKMTARQFLELGEDPPGIRLELVDGEIELSPSPIPKHSYVDRMLTIILGQHIVERGLGRLYGDVDTIFGEHDVRRPDLIFFRKDRVHLVGPKAMEGPPDLCVEILSPSSIDNDREVKFELYEEAGVAHYWIIDPSARTLEAYSLINGRFQPAGGGSGDDAVRLPPFSELEIPLGRLWEPAA
jgi:Uma2 family endonuclease